ncbi:Uncharacterised protein [Vibrio cholerae]|nr:Uncharacterised protein [Vibrio cholerae]
MLFILADVLRRYPKLFIPQFILSLCKMYVGGCGIVVWRNNLVCLKHRMMSYCYRCQGSSYLLIFLPSR